MEVQIKGKVSITVKRGDNTVKQIRKNNNIDINFAETVGSLLMFGTNSQYAGSYASTFSLPQSIVVLLLNNGVVVAQIQTTVQGFSDTLTSTAETTLITFIGSDATTSQYTFNQLELYTVSNNALFLKISDAYLSTPITKGQNDQVQVTWEIGVVATIPFVQFYNVSINDCNATCNNQTTCQQNALQGYQASVFNFLVVLLITPNLPQVLQNQNVPMSSFLNNYVPGAIPVGITQINFFDSCFNSVYTWTATNGQVASAGVTYDSNYVYVTLNVIATPTAQVQYMVPFTSFTGGGVAFKYPIAITTTSGISIANQQQVFGLLLKIPYGPSTLVSLNTAV